MDILVDYKQKPHQIKPFSELKQVSCYGKETESLNIGI